MRIKEREKYSIRISERYSSIFIVSRIGTIYDCLKESDMWDGEDMGWLNRNAEHFMELHNHGEDGWVALWDIINDFSDLHVITPISQIEIAEDSKERVESYEESKLYENECSICHGVGCSWCDDNIRGLRLGY